MLFLKPLSREVEQLKQLQCCNVDWMCMTLLGYVAVGHTKNFGEMKLKKKILDSTQLKQTVPSMSFSSVLWFCGGYLILAFCWFCFVFSFSLDFNLTVVLEYSNLQHLAWNKLEADPALFVAVEPAGPGALWWR